MTDLKRPYQEAPSDGRKDEGENAPGGLPEPTDPRDREGWATPEITPHKTSKSYGRVAAIVAGVVIIVLVLFTITQA